ALVILGIEVDRRGEAAMGTDRLGIVAMAMQLAAARSGVAADAHHLAPGDAILEGAADLREEARLQPAVDEGIGIGLDQPMIDAVIPAVFGDAHLIVGGHLVVA